jgi:hypothetical protein
MSRLIHDSSPELQEAGFSRRLAWRRIVLEVIGIGLVMAGLMVSWPPPDDPALPATRPFLVLVGLLLFSAGVALEFRPARHRHPYTDRDN